MSKANNAVVDQKTLAPEWVAVTELESLRKDGIILSYTDSKTNKDQIDVVLGGGLGTAEIVFNVPGIVKGYVQMFTTFPTTHSFVDVILTVGRIRAYTLQTVIVKLHQYAKNGMTTQSLVHYYNQSIKRFDTTVVYKPVVVEAKQQPKQQSEPTACRIHRPNSPVFLRSRPVPQVINHEDDYDYDPNDDYVFEESSDA